MSQTFPNPLHQPPPQALRFSQGRGKRLEMTRKGPCCYDAWVQFVGWKTASPSYTRLVDRQWVALNSHNEQGGTYFKNYIFVRHYSCRHFENEICQTSRPLAPSRLPLHARTFSSRERERDVWVMLNKAKKTSFAWLHSVAMGLFGNRSQMTWRENLVKS